MGNLPWYGVDVSEWQPPIDWVKVKAAGKEFAFVRAGRSLSVDKRFTQHIEGAIAAGLHVGAYWFCEATNAQSAAAETAKCLETIAPYKDKIDMPVAYDFEGYTVKKATAKGVKLDKVSGTAICKAFVDAVQAADYIPAIYTGISFLTNYIDMTQFKAVLWNAAWASYDPPIKSNAERWPIWQYTVLQPTGALASGYTRGSVDGINGAVDLDICYVDYPALYAEKKTVTLDTVMAMIKSMLAEKGITKITL